MFVVKRSGKKEEVQFDKITKRIKHLIKNDEECYLNATLVGQKVISFIHDNITTEELDIESSKICANLCTTHPLYSNLGGRILVSNLQKKTSVSFIETVKEIQQSNNYFDENYYSWLLENADELDNMIDHKRDYKFDYFGFKTLERAYLIKNMKTGHIYERPQYMYMRVASFLNQGNLETIKKTYDSLSLGEYIHASPTLFNSGSKRSQLSSCFLLGTDDSMDGITDTWKSVSLISKEGGGIGLHVSNIRSKGSLIRGTNGPSSGIIPMLQVYNSIARYVNQCFIGSTKVYTKRGLVSIETLKVGDKVFTGDGTLQEIQKIYNDVYNKDVLDISVFYRDKPVSVTPEHPFLVIKNQSKSIDHVTLKHKFDKNSVEHEWIEAKYITEDDLITLSIPVYEKDIYLYNDDDCYFYGIMLQYGKYDSTTFSVTTKDIKLYEFLRNYLKINLLDYTSGTENFYDNAQFKLIWFISSKFKFTPNDFNFYTQGNIYYNENMINLPLSKINMIIKGFIDSSYSNDYCKEFKFKLGSLKLMELVNYMLLRMGILTKIYKEYNFNSRLVQYIIEIPKTKEIATLLNIEEDKRITSFFRYGDCIYTRIESIKMRKVNELVYDLEIAENHNYLTEIGIVHNGGKRKGSIAIYLEPHHDDIFEFLNLRKNFGDENLRARDLFLALWVSDLFMKQVKSDGDWYLMCPDECKNLENVWGEEYETLYWNYVNENKFRRKIKARKLMMAIWESQQETGTPYITYKDNVNRKSNQKNIGTIKSSNLCNEIVEYSDKDEHAVCNLASIALNTMLTPYNYKDKYFVIYSKKDCKFCTYSKNWLNYNQVSYEEHTLNTNDMDHGKEFFEALNQRILSMGVTLDKITFPQIFYKQKGKYHYVGGFIELYKKTAYTYNYTKLYEVAYNATKNLNKVIDINYYPTPETKKSNLRHRPIGLGIQGLADVLIQMRIPFDSDEAIELNSKIMETIYFAAMKSSCDLSKERYNDFYYILTTQNKQTGVTDIPLYYDASFNHPTNNKEYHALKLNKCELESKNTNRTIGSYSTFTGSPLSKGIFQFNMWDYDKNKLNLDWDGLREEVVNYGVRNSLLVALMPTASTSQILGNNECFEFFTSNIYTRNTLAGDFPIINKYLVNDLISMNEWNTDVKDLIVANNGSIQHLNYLPSFIRRLYQTQWELKQIWVLKAAKARGPFVDQTQSMNIFMTEPDDQKLNSCLFWGWENGLKTGMYYLRTKPATNAQKVTIDPNLLKKMNSLSLNKATTECIGDSCQIPSKTNNSKEEDECIMCSA
jgi:ribonucleotide reductase alpha subunit